MIAVLVATVFAAIALVHVYWAFGGRLGKEAAVPRAPARPDADAGTPLRAAFEPSTAATLAVAVAMAGVAVLVCLRGGLFGESAWQWLIGPVLGIVALALFARAVGDFKLVGFFKRRTDSRFATMDTWFYSPLCVALGAGLIAIVLA